MSYEKLIAKGAESVNGHVYLNRKLLGICTPDGFVMTAEGEAELAVEDVAFKEVQADKPAKAPKAPKAPKVEVAPAPAPELPSDDDLLAGLEKLG